MCLKRAASSPTCLSWTTWKWAASAPNDSSLTEAVGSGPYKLAEYTRGDHYLLKANEDYWGEPPVNDTVVFRWSSEAAQRLVELESGTADGIDNVGTDDFDAQCVQIFKNIEAALASCGAGWKNVVQFTTYLVHSQDIPKFMAWRLREFPKMFPDGKYPPNTLLVIDRLVGEQYLVEVQAIAAL